MESLDMFIDDITKYKMKKSAELIINNDSDYADYHLPSNLVDKQFHNNIFLKQIILNHKIDKCPEDNHKTRKLLKLDRMELNVNYSEVLQTALDDLKMQLTAIEEEFFDDNDGEHLMNCICDIDCAIMFEKLLQENKHTDKFKKVLEQIMVDAHNREETLYSEGIRKYLLETQENIENLMYAFPDYAKDYRDATILYGRLNMYIQEVICTAKDLSYKAIPQKHQYEISKNSHKAVEISKKEFKKFLDACQSSHEQELSLIKSRKRQNTFNSLYNSFQSHMFQYKLRSNYSPTNTFIMSTRELENLLIKLIKYSTHNIQNFIQFLLNNNIQLPLSHYKSCVCPAFLMDFDNDTIQRAFIIEGQDKMYNMDEMRKDALTKKELAETNNRLIHLESKVPVK